MNATDLAKPNYKQIQRDCEQRARMVRVHSIENRTKAGNVLKFTKGVYEVQANGSLRRVG